MSNNTDDEKMMHFAQLQAIRWLQSRCEDQMVGAWLRSERELLDRMDYPVTATGGLLKADNNNG